MSKAILTVVAINLGLMGAARLPFPKLATTTTQPEIVVHPTPTPTPEVPTVSTPAPSPMTVERDALAATVTRCQNFAGANFRTVPSLDDAAIVDVIPCNASVVLTGNRIHSDGEVWMEAEWHSDRGWVAQVMLTPPHRVRVGEVISPDPTAPLPQQTQSNLVQVRYGL